MHFDLIKWSIQLLAYNSELYANVTYAKKSPYGIAVVAILAAVGIPTNFLSKAVLICGRR